MRRRLRVFGLRASASRSNSGTFVRAWWRFAKFKIASSRLKSALHRLILVLPVTLLIFAEALRHQDEKIELPILKLGIQIRLVMPLFLLLISYMLSR
jgi:hypothetical protein